MKQRFQFLLAALCLSGAANLSAAETTSRPEAITYHEHIAPILFEHCAPCHRPGQAGPFSLLNYADAQKRAKDIAEVTTRRYMPPWLPAPGPHPFRGDRRMADTDIDRLQRWAAAGAPEGDPAKSPPTPVWPSDWQLGKPDLIVRLAEPYTVPADGRDVYRNFVLPLGLDRRRHVAAWELRPNSRTAHHVFVRVDRTGEGRRRDALDPEPGFPGMDSPPGVVPPNGHFASWQPGAAPTRNPPGLGWTLEPDTDLVLQFHLQPRGKPEPLQPEIGLYFTDQAPTNRPIKFGLVNYSFDLPPGSTNQVARDEFTLPADADLLGVLPHSHYLGHRIEARAIRPDGSDESLLLIPDWDFNWQGAYLYREPVFLPAGTRVTMAISFDNSTNNFRNPFSPPRRTQFGVNTTDEMAEFWLQLLPRTPAGAAAIDRALLERTIRDKTAYNEQRLRRDPNDGLALVNLGRTLLAQQRVPEAEAYFKQATRIAPQLDEAHYYLGLAYRLRHRTGDATAEFVRTLELNTNHARANGNLGFLHLEAGQPERAADYLAAAIRLDPTDAMARSTLGQIRLQQGRRAEAAALFRRALELDPGNTESRDGLAAIKKAESAAK